MYILGICNGYIANATLLKGGKVVASASEERFNGIKSYNGFPKMAIEWCLKEAGINGKNLDLVTLPYLTRPPFSAGGEEKSKFKSISFLVFSIVKLDIVRQYFRKLRYYFPFLRFPGMVLYRISAFIIGTYYTKKQKEFISNFLKIDKKKIKAYDHHLSHAAASYYASPFNKEKALVLTLDGEGDNYCASVNIFKRNEIKVLAKTPREFSFGYIFAHLTKFLGMKPHEHEYKVMGLAPYARKEDVDRIYNKIKYCITLNKKNKLKFYMPKNAQDFGIYLRKNLLEVRFDHLAGAFQALLEERVLEWIKHAIKVTGISNIVLGGGVFMNVKLNQKIAELEEVKKIFILPSCGDESAPLGSCYLGLREIFLHDKEVAHPSPIENVYWGPRCSPGELEKDIEDARRRGHKVKRVKGIEKEIAILLSKGKVVAHFSSNMEFGARALGNRSLLADPRNIQIVKDINMKMKNRDFWMPFAPTILWERANDYIINTKKLESPYMMIAFDTTELGKKELISAMHQYDSTVRAQLLTEGMNGRYYKILKEFEKLTGVGGVLNTSFNLHGHPIVKSPKDALFAFEHSGLEYLVLEEYLLEKK